MGIDGGYRIRVHPQNLCLRQEVLQLLLHLLGAEADLLESTSALGAAGGKRLGMAAVVAHEPSVGVVIGQVDRAAGTHGHIAAVHTGHHTAGAAPVEKEDGLPTRREILPQRQQQRLTDGRSIALLQLLLHVDDLHRRQGLAVIAAAQLVEGIDAGFCAVHGLHAGRGGPQKHQCL